MRRLVLVAAVLGEAWVRGAAIGIGELPLAGLLDRELTVIEAR